MSHLARDPRGTRGIDGKANVGCRGLRTFSGGAERSEAAK